MKKNDVAVEGDVGQVVAGNVVHEGARASSQLSNVITISANKPEPPARTITELQRKRIAAKVKEVMQVAGITRQLDVYSVVLTDFGIEKILDLPRDQFKPVMQTLDNWIAEEKEEPSEQAQPVQNGAEHVCGGCQDLAAKVGTHQKKVRVVTAMALIAVGVACYSLYAGSTLASAIAASAPHACQHEGKDYSLGSVVRMPDNRIFECTADEKIDEPPAWEPAKASPGAGKRKV